MIPMYPKFACRLLLERSLEATEWRVHEVELVVDAREDFLGGACRALVLWAFEFA